VIIQIDCAHIHETRDENLKRYGPHGAATVSSQDIHCFYDLKLLHLIYNDQ